jgi:hypothetical protein
MQLYQSEQGNDMVCWETSEPSLNKEIIIITTREINGTHVCTFFFSVLRNKILYNTHACPSIIITTNNSHYTCVRMWSGVSILSTHRERYIIYIIGRTQILVSCSMAVELNSQLEMN